MQPWKRHVSLNTASVQRRRQAASAATAYCYQRCLAVMQQHLLCDLQSLSFPRRLVQPQYLLFNLQHYSRLQLTTAATQFQQRLSSFIVQSSPLQHSAATISSIPRLHSHIISAAAVIHTRAANSDTSAIRYLGVRSETASMFSFQRRVKKSRCCALSVYMQRLRCAAASAAHSSA